MSQNKCAAILNSRQSMRPTSSQAWIISSQKAVNWIYDNSYTLVSSVGMPTWDALTAMGSIKRLPMKLIIPVDNSVTFQNQIKAATIQFGLDSELVTFIQCDKHERDKKIINQAEIIVPVSIRSEGLLEKFIGDVQETNKKVSDEFRVRFETRSTKLSYTLEGVELNPELKNIKTNYIVHWTRTSNRLWPDELLIDYYRAIFSCKAYPRLAIDTLQHMLKTNRILAGESNFEKGVRAVSFSSVSPHELVSLVKWRARKRQMAFEPYGLGFEPELADQLGIKAVVYYNKESGVPETDSSENKIDGWQLQSQGTITDWRNEKEFRYPGDIFLNRLDKSRMILFCLKPDEAEILSSNYGIKAVSFLP